MRQEMGQGRTVLDAIEAYEVHLRERELRPRTVKVVVSRLRKFLPRFESLENVTSGLIGKRVQERRTEGMAVDSVVAELSSVRVFVKWCIEKSWLPKLDLSGVKVVGRRKRGKPQLRIDEARRYLDVALRWDSRGLASAMPLLMGLRASEILRRQVRDLDDGGKLLWIERAKTERGNRRVEVPEVIRARLLEQVDGRGAEGPIFPNREGRCFIPRDLLGWVQEVCEKAGVPRVCTHALRGSFATFAEQAGVASHVVAATLGHTSPTVTGSHYTLPEAREQAKGRKTILRIVG